MVVEIENSRNLLLAVLQNQKKRKFALQFCENWAITAKRFSEIGREGRSLHQEILISAVISGRTGIPVRKGAGKACVI